MPIPYDVFIKHAAKICKNALLVQPTKPMLACVKHLENGDAVATDAHRLYLAKSVHSFTDGRSVIPNGKQLYGDYPDVARVIPGMDPKQILKLDTSELLKGADIIASIGPLTQDEQVMKLLNNQMQFNSLDLKINYFLPKNEPFLEQISLNPQYLFEAMKLFKAVGCERTTWHFYGRMRPIKLTNDDESLIAIILPIRSAA